MKIYADDLVAELELRGVKAVLWHSGGSIHTLNIGDYDEDSQRWSLVLGPDDSADELPNGAGWRTYFDPQAELYLGPDDDGVSPALTVESDCTTEQLVEIIVKWIQTGESPVAVEQPKSRLPEKEFEVREATGLRRDDYRWELSVRDRHVETVHGLNPNDLVRLSRAVEEFMRDPSA